MKRLLLVLVVLLMAEITCLASQKPKVTIDQGKDVKVIKIENSDCLEIIRLDSNGEVTSIVKKGECHE